MLQKLDINFRIFTYENPYRQKWKGELFGSIHWELLKKLGKILGSRGSLFMIFEKNRIGGF